MLKGFKHSRTLLMQMAIRLNSPILLFVLCQCSNTKMATAAACSWGGQGQSRRFLLSNETIFALSSNKLPQCEYGATLTCTS